jgi:type IV pilus assembly protein PilB
MATQINTPPLAGLSGIARRLVGENLLEENDARKAVEDAARQKIPIGAYLIEHGLASSANVAMALATEFGLPLIDVNALDLSLVPIKLVREDLITKHKALPLFKRGMRLFVGISDPTNLRALDEIKFQSNHIVEPIIVDDSHLERAIEQALTTARPSPILAMMPRVWKDSKPPASTRMASTGVDANSTDDAPVVKFVNKVLVDAIKRGASDIHFEPYETDYRVRFRMDGMLRAVAAPPAKLSPRISSRLKVMSGLDIAEKRVPQDGRIKLNLSKTKSIDFRVSTCPTLFGEKIVLRILDASPRKWASRSSATRTTRSSSSSTQSPSPTAWCS